MDKPVIYATNQNGPLIYLLDGREVPEVEAWRMINAGEVEFNDEGATDYYALSNGLGRYDDIYVLVPYDGIYGGG